MSHRRWGWGVRAGGALAVAIGCLAGGIFSVLLAAADGPTTSPSVAPPPLAAAEDEQPGLSLSFARPGTAPADAREARLVSLYVPAGTNPTPFVAPGPFVAVWDGDLNLKIRDAYSFVARGRGKLTVTINEVPVLDVSGDDLSQKVGDEVRLKKGKNRVVVRYESPAAGDAAVRLLWRVKGEPLPEPIPPQLWTHDAGEKTFRQSRRLREGRSLLAELRCVECHATPEIASLPPEPSADAVAAARPGPMPELGMDAPSLADAGARLNRAWVAAWVNDPRALRPDAHMPRVFHDGKAAGRSAPPSPIDPRAADVAAYLASLGKPAGEADAAPAADRVQAGGVLFASLNCVACHLSPEADAAPPAANDAADGPPPLARLGLGHVKAKFTPDGLTRYLRDPQAHYRWNPMPNFRLSAGESARLAAYLLASASPPPAGDAPPGDAAKGRALVASSGCLNCHALGTEKSTHSAPPFGAVTKEEWERRLAAGPDFHAAGPRFDLTDGERAALAASGPASVWRDSPAEFAERQVAALRCAACHARDGRESLLATSYDADQKMLEAKYPPPPPAAGEFFAPDQRAPLLTWAGEKLQPDWLAAFVGGRVDYKPRPYLRARMPAFAARAGGLAAGLAEEHGYPPAPEARPAPDPAMVPAGRLLAGRTPNQSFSCAQCHAVADVPPFAPFEAPAINFAHARDRLRKDYFHRWVHDPIRIDPATKMPTFERDGKTALTDVYDGDARKQFEAIWQYLLAGKDILPPG